MKVAYLFGGTRIVSGFAAVLLARLALAGETGCSREELVDAFWPQEDLQVARPRLRQVLLTLRSAMKQAGFSEEVIKADRSQIRLNFSVITFDIVAFDAALKSSDWAKAEILYTGDLLPGVDDPVVALERERLRLSYQNVLRHLAEAQEQAGDLVRALDYAVRLVSLDVHDEQHSLLLLRLMIAAGHHAAARRHYRKLKRTWQESRGESLPTAVRKQVRQWFAAAVVTTAAATAGISGATTETGLSSSVTEASRAPLPPTFTRFFGRQSEVNLVLALLRENNSRLLTLTGPGGSGKTRLAIEIVQRAENDLQPWKVWFVPLADIRDTALLDDQILQSLRIARDPQKTPLEQAVHVLREGARPTLLILDNVEHLLEQSGVTMVVSSLLAAVPDLVCLATSRQPLEAPGEREIPIAPLPLPPVDQVNGLSTQSLEQITKYPSIALFIDRMCAVRPEFRLTARNASTVADLCRRLDGLPLALEIAATWARTLTPSQMIAQLESAERRWAFLVSRRQHVTETPRHASLQAAIEWSYRRLAPDVQRFFTRLHVFRGGFSEQAAAAVCEDPRALEFLATLQERSLIQGMDLEVPGQEPQIRFRMLETLREYARDRMSAVERTELCRRHATYFAELAESAEPEMLRADQARWGAILQTETDNLRAALDWALSPEGDNVLGLRQAGARWRSWPLFAHLAEARRYLEQLLAQLPAESPVAVPGHTKAVFALGVIAFYQGDSAEGIRRAEQCLRLPHLPEDAWVVAFNQSWLGVMEFYAGRFVESADALSRGLELSRAVGDDWLVGYALAFSGFLAMCRGDLAKATQFSSKSLALSERIGEKWLLSLSAMVLGQFYFYEQGDAIQANALVIQALNGFRELSDVWCTSFVQSLYGFLLERQERTEEALQLHQDNLRTNNVAGAKLHIANSLEGIAEAVSALNHLETAGVLWGAAEALHEQIGLTVWPFLRAFRDPAIARASAVLGQPAFTTAWERGRVMPAEEAIALALNFCF